MIITCAKYLHSARLNSMMVCAQFGCLSVKTLCGSENIVTLIVAQSILHLILYQKHAFKCEHTRLKHN